MGSLGRKESIPGSKLYSEMYLRGWMHEKKPVR